VDESELATLVTLVVKSVLAGSMPPGVAQIVIRPILTWPDGEAAVWIAVNGWN
jgi:hypothetical protein